MDVTITFTPDHTGEEHATMLIESDATGGTQEVELVGSGVVRYTVDGSLSFGTVDKNSTTTKCFQINNTSATDIAIDQVQLSGANPTSFTISTPTPLAIAAGSTKELCLQFMPTDVGDYAATVSFKSMNGGNLDGATNGTCEIAASVTLDALEAGIVAFPNPSSESVTVTTGDVMPTDVRVVTTTGQYVTTLDPAKQLTWNLSDTNGAAVPSGTYVLVISDKHSTYRMMLQIVR